MASVKGTALGNVVKLWLQDTGCGHDLVGRDEIRRLSRLIRAAADPIKFATANGGTPTCTDAIDLYIKELDELISPCP